MIPASPLLGSALHSVGAMSAALCYTPQQKLQGWSWQTYWLSQALICWFIAPIIGAFVTIPDLIQVLQAAPKDAMLVTFLLGVAYGIGGTAFGLAIRYVGYSLTYAIAIGISCVLGTLTGPVVSGTLKTMMDKPGFGWVMAGVFVGLAGTLLCGFAGRMKEVELEKDQNAKQPFMLTKGLTLCLIAGVLSAIYGIAINDTGKPIADTAARFGAGHWQTNIVYIFVNSGAFLTTALYTIVLGIRNKTFGEFRRVNGHGSRALTLNYLMSLLTGCMWYAQFLFYGLAHVRMGAFEFSSWAIHMTMLILFSTIAGLAMKEWHGRSRRTQAAITLALTVLVAAVLILTYGNYLGQQPPVH